MNPKKHNPDAGDVLSAHVRARRLFELSDDKSAVRFVGLDYADFTEEVARVYARLLAEKVQYELPHIAKLEEVYKLTKDIDRKLSERTIDLSEKKPMSEMISQLRLKNIELSEELNKKIREINFLKEILRKEFRPKRLMKMSTYGLILSASSLLVSFVYSFHLFHPIVAGSLLMVSLVFLVISKGLQKDETALG